jgi:hypothetical protein
VGQQRLLLLLSSFLRRSLTASFRFSSLELGAPGEPAFLSAIPVGVEIGLHQVYRIGRTSPFASLLLLVFYLCIFCTCSRHLDPVSSCIPGSISVLNLYLVTCVVEVNWNFSLKISIGRYLLVLNSPLGLVVLVKGLLVSCTGWCLRNSCWEVLRNVLNRSIDIKLSYEQLSMWLIR